MLAKILHWLWVLYTVWVPLTFSVPSSAQTEAVISCDFTWDRRFQFVKGYVTNSWHLSMFQTCGMYNHRFNGFTSYHYVIIVLSYQGTAAQVITSLLHLNSATNTTRSSFQHLGIRRVFYGKCKTSWNVVSSSETTSGSVFFSVIALLQSSTPENTCFNMKPVNSII